MLEADVASNLRKTHQRLNYMLREKVGEYKLTFRLLHILIRIESKPEANQNQIAKELKFTKGAMSGYVKRLIELGMLEKRSSTQDQRCNRLGITDYGQNILDDYEEEVRSRYKDIFIGFSSEELAAFDASLTKINHNLKKLGLEENKSREGGTST